MRFINWFLYCLKNKYFDFEGRASRTEFWSFYLISFVIALVLGLFENLVVVIINLIIALALLIPNLAVAVRRLHDTGRSGLWILAPLVISFILVGLFLAFDSVFVLWLGVIPCALYVAILFFLAMPSQAGSNQYGESAPEEPLK